MTTLAPPRARVLRRRRLEIRGVVQGVGFRPFVHRLAGELGLSGHVGNDADGVWVEVEGEQAALDAFACRLVGEAPPVARIAEVRSSSLEPTGQQGFEVVPNRTTGGVHTLVPPDVAVCDDCLAELFDRRDRRYRDPFINCTNCGPRFTVTVRLPYDRPNTTMAGFPMCPACAAEYADPKDRRFHAQPIACPACGPRLWFEAPGRPRPHPEGDGALAAAQEMLADGKVVAIKGIGGYHLACDATNPAAVELLRQRTGQGDKPFAVMVPSLPAARRLASIGAAEAALLAGPQRPIVLLGRRPGAALADAVAPGNHRLGLLLPYSPVHHLLQRSVPGSGQPVPRALVMTSANRSEEPICHRDDDARRCLAEVADGWLVHDRPIHVPCGDSVVQVVDGEELPVRRARGHAPLPVRLPFEVPPVLAVGAQLENTFCLAAGRQAWLSQHLGDMGGLETLAAFERSVRQFADFYQVAPEAVAADLHPGYVTRRWAERRAAATGERLVLVPHHHAHVAAVMAEHGLGRGSRVLGFVFDGTGWGVDDGAVWGGEVLVAGYAEADRVAHLRMVPLPGGDAAARKPYRIALSHLRAAGIDWVPDLAPVEAAGPELPFLRRQLDTGAGCVRTSSVGRLFDAVGAVLGLCQEVTFEAEAAMRLEAAAEQAPGARRAAVGRERSPADAGYRFGLDGDELDPRPVLAAIVADLRAGREVAEIALGFHRALAVAIADTAEYRCRGEGPDVVVLSGGVFQNRLLVRLARRQLALRGLQVLTHRLVPPNDGGLALGQAVVAAAWSAAGRGVGGGRRPLVHRKERPWPSPGTGT